MNEEKNKIHKKTVKTGRCFVESGPEKEKRDSYPDSHFYDLIPAPSFLCMLFQ